MDQLVSNPSEGFGKKGKFTIKKLHYQEKEVVLEAVSIDEKITENNDWFDLEIIITVGAYQFPFIRLTSYIRDNNRLFPLPNDKFFLIPEEWMKRYNGVARFAKN